MVLSDFVNDLILFIDLCGHHHSLPCKFALCLQYYLMDLPHTWNNRCVGHLNYLTQFRGQCDIYLMVQ